MALPEYIDSSKITLAKAAIHRSYQSLEQEINALSSKACEIREVINGLDKSMISTGGAETKQKLIKKLDNIDSSIDHITKCLNNIGGEPKVVTEHGSFIDTSDIKYTTKS